MANLKFGNFLGADREGVRHTHTPMSSPETYIPVQGGEGGTPICKVQPALSISDTSVTLRVIVK